MSPRLEALAAWWDKFATHRSQLDRGHFRAARPASRPTTWPPPCGPGTRRAPRPATWPSGASHAEQFRSPKAYALVVDALLEQRDPVAAMALLVQWLSQAERDPAGRGELLLPRPGPGLDGRVVGRGAVPAGRRAAPPPDRWALARKFLDYLEANAEEYWAGAAVRAGRPPAPAGSDAAEEPADDDEDDLFSAAYEDMTYRDSTDDGFEGEMLEGGQRPEPPTSSWCWKPSGSSCG